VTQLLLAPGRVDLIGEQTDYSGGQTSTPSGGRARWNGVVQGADRRRSIVLGGADRRGRALPGGDLRGSVVALAGAGEAEAFLASSVGAPAVRYAADRRLRCNVRQGRPDGVQERVTEFIDNRVTPPFKDVNDEDLIQRQLSPYPPSGSPETSSSAGGCSLGRRASRDDERGWHHVRGVAAEGRRSFLW
jgi:hypothetical protein